MVTFTVNAKTTLSPDYLVEQILNVSNWADFSGWGPIPGIREATIIERTEAGTGTRFAVTNVDGSTHEETIIEYVPSQRIVMKIENFSAPLNKFAKFFIETWNFDRQGGQTCIERQFELHPKNPIANIFLKLLGFGLKKAIEAHTAAIAPGRTDP